MPFKTTYREYKGKRFRFRTAWQEAVPARMAEYSRNWKKQESGRDPDTAQWAKARPRYTIVSIWHANDWHYCFANVSPKHVKKWLDYYAARY